MDTIPHLTTPRTRLTVIGPEHAAAIAAYYCANREHLEPWEPLRDAAFYTVAGWRARAADLRAAFARGTAAPLVVLAPEAERVIGICQFSQIVRGSFQACYLGYSLGREWEGRGLMREAAAAGIAYVFDTLGLHRIMANHMPRNERSARLLQHLGFEREGYARAYLNIAGRWEDHVLNALINPRMPAGRTLA
ncbi:MAG: ribosomal protein S5-alanine N-acetyltransferase [Mizugakiibacter sp.]|uniref:ribosomal protein S5-alanine N-acetyltransferase n=1 Tax=Mizugakiibacter sp. TaxID=1972610 RepID=UPI0031C3A7A8|nr:ribosomal protein S5-alanine N-acetyltransferase [Xanthomonadaceae bacterium]